MSGMGKGSAATVATNLGFSYTEIQLALIVGVCGGAPRLPADKTDGPGSTKDVFLGDVIISNAVVQYDFGRQNSDGFVRKTAVTDILGRPNQEVRSLLAGIKAKRAHREFLENMARHMQALREADTLWQHPKLDDVLYDSSCAHTNSSEPHPNPVRCSCLNDDPRQKTSAARACNSGCHKNSSSIIRRRRQHDEHSASVHIGTMASGNRVIKSAEHRAGVWDVLSCLIIKGVCYYADSHKSKTWQPYAAAAGASAAKAFLNYWRPASRQH
ncbi:nucleoside phosphorylase domain-containing protein [Aspergillus germanicus]